MRVHSAEKIKRLKSLRALGYSINELVTKLSIPKTTVWHHIKDVRVLPPYFLALKAKRGGSKLRFIRNTQEAQKRANDLLQGPDRERVIALAMLYWAEGHKRKVCEFTNSDGSMIKLYLKILRQTVGVQEYVILPILRIFGGMNSNKCLSYWSNVIGMPKNKFKIRYNDGGTRGRTPYGMCKISLRQGSQTLKLFHALIDQLKEEL